VTRWQQRLGCRAALVAFFLDPERRHGDRDDEEVKVNKCSGAACITEGFGSTLQLRRRRH
jgi:hypothetical protein